MAYSTTLPIHGDSEIVLLKKLLQLFGGSTVGPDGKPQLLSDILTAANNGGGGGSGSGSSTVVFSFALTGNEDALAVLAGVEQFRAPFAFHITDVRISLNDPSTAGGPITVDINKGGATILSTKLTIDDNETTSVTAAIPAVVSDDAIADDEEITFDIDAIGNGQATGLKVTIVGTED
jgi:hypothetical protein